MPALSRPSGPTREVAGEWRGRALGRKGRTDLGGLASSCSCGSGTSALSPPDSPTPGPCA